MKKGRWRSREQDVGHQPLCGEARQDSSKHGEYSASLLRQLAKQSLELGEESGELRPEISSLGTGGDYMGIRGGKGFWVWHSRLGVGQGGKLAGVASVVWSGRARGRGPRAGGRSTPSCL